MKLNAKNFYKQGFFLLLLKFIIYTPFDTHHNTVTATLDIFPSTESLSCIKLNEIIEVYQIFIIIISVVILPMTACIQKKMFSNENILEEQKDDSTSGILS